MNHEFKAITDFIRKNGLVQIETPAIYATNADYEEVNTTAMYKLTDEHYEIHIFKDFVHIELWLGELVNSEIIHLYFSR